MARNLEQMSLMGQILERKLKGASRGKKDGSYFEKIYIKVGRIRRSRDNSKLDA